MSRQIKSLTDVAQLIQTTELLSKAVQVIVAEWSKEVEPLGDQAGIGKGERQILPSHELYDAQRTILAATGKLTELVSEPSVRILEVATQFQESRALYIAAERRIPDILVAKDKTGGTPISEISEKAKIESRKLCTYPVDQDSQVLITCRSSHFALLELDRNLQANWC
jgi:hypothetical protein